MRSPLRSKEEMEVGDAGASALFDFCASNDLWYYRTRTGWHPPIRNEVWETYELCQRSGADG